MEDNLHPAVKLLIARMESHPDEFLTYDGRWDRMMDDVLVHAQGDDLKALSDARSKIHLDRTHKDLMDELLNGDERREKLKQQEQERIAADKARLMQEAAANYAMQQAQMQAQKYGNTSSFPYTSGDYRNAMLGGLTNTISNANALQIGNEKLDESILKRLKGLLK